MLNAALRLLDENRTKRSGPRTIAHSFTGNDGIKMKTVTMNAFADFGVLVPDEPELCDKYDYAAARHYKIQILCATAAANAGVNSLWLNDVDYKGLVPSLYDPLQALGRADRRLVADDTLSTQDSRSPRFSIYP